MVHIVSDLVPDCMHDGQTENYQCLDIGQHALPLSALHVPMQRLHHEIEAHKKIRKSSRQHHMQVSSLSPLC